MEEPPQKAGKKRKKGKISFLKSVRPHPSCSETRPFWAKTHPPERERQRRSEWKSHPRKRRKKELKKSVRPHPSSLRPAPKVSEHAPSGLTRETEKVRMERQKRKRKKKVKKKKTPKVFWCLKKEKS